jgi:hypothetical protein
VIKSIQSEKQLILMPFDPFALFFFLFCEKGEKRRQKEAKGKCTFPDGLPHQKYKNRGGRSVEQHPAGQKCEK